MKKQNYSYIGISFIILLFGIIFIPKILNRINNDGVVDKDRHNLERNDTQNDTLAFIGNKKVPAFQFANQNGDSISNADYKGKVYGYLPRNEPKHAKGC